MGGGSRDAGTVVIVGCGTRVVAFVLVDWYSMVMVPSSPLDSAFVVIVCVLVGAGIVVGGESDVCPAFRSDSSWLDVGPACE